MATPEEPPAQRTVQLDDPLPDELRHAAEMDGVRDAETTWRKFCGRYATRTCHVAGEWRVWYLRERTFQRTAASRTNGAHGLAPSNAEQAEAERRGKRVSQPPDERPMTHDERAAAAADVLGKIGGARG